MGWESEPRYGTALIATKLSLGTLPDSVKTLAEIFDQHEVLDEGIAL